MTATLAPDQLALFGDIVAPEYTPELTLPQRYAAWISANPHVLDAFERLAEQWFAAGHERVGMKAIAETARWQTGLRSVDSEWKVDNSFVAFLSRDLIARRPEWASRIATRQQKAVAA